MLTADDSARNDLGDAVAQDPGVRQARLVAELARRRLCACVSTPADEFDPAEAQRFLDNFNAARRLAEDAEERVLAHFGQLTPARLTRRAAPGPADQATTQHTATSARVVEFHLDRLPRPPAIARRTAAQVAKNVLVPIAAGLAGVALARRGLRR